MTPRLAEIVMGKSTAQQAGRYELKAISPEIAHSALNP